MGCEIFPNNSRKSAGQEAPNSCFLADALSGHCSAMPCRVRDETYIKVKGKWTYYYRAIEKFRKTLDFMLSEHRDEAAATAFFTRAIGNNGFPDRVVIGKSGANLAGLQKMNCLLILNGWFWLIEVLQVKYLNNIIEQDHRFIKKLTRHMKGFKSFKSASATLEGIEVAHMIRKHNLRRRANPHSSNLRLSLDNCV
jgi:putative transposase